MVSTTSSGRSGILIVVCFCIVNCDVYWLMPRILLPLPLTGGLLVVVGTLCFTIRAVSDLFPRVKMKVFCWCTFRPTVCLNYIICSYRTV